MRQGIFSKRIAILITLFILMFQLTTVIPQKANAAALNNAAMITVVDESGETIIPMSVVKLGQDDTALEVLKEVAEKKNVDFKYTNDPQYGAYINMIGKSTPSGQDYWGFFIDGSDAPVGISSYKVKNGDDLLFKIVSYPTATVKSKVSAKNKKGDLVFPETDVAIVDGANAYDALKQAAKAKNIKLDTTIDSNWFAYVNNLADTKLGDTDYWSISLNGKGMDVGLSTYKIKDGDQLELNLVGPDDSGSDEDTPGDNNGSEESNDNSNINPISKQQIEFAIKTSAPFVLKNGGSDEFEVVALRKSGQKVPNTYLNNIKKMIKENDGTFRNVTDYERYVIGISAAGGNATNIEGYNLIKKIYTNDRMTSQGTNGVVYALLAYDSGKYDVPSDAAWTREKLVKYLIDHQLKDGGWALYGDSPSVDITAMTLAALAPYKTQENVKTAINKATQWISSKQDKNGGFSSTINGGDASETTAQVIIGLSSVGVDPTGKLFSKSGGNLIQHLLAFQQKDGGFSHILTDKSSNLIATTQALIGLTAYQQYVNESGSVYQFENKSLPTDQTNTNKTDDKTATQTNKQITGEPLPNTATNQYNILLIGALLLIIGGVLYVNSRKKRV